MTEPNETHSEPGPDAGVDDLQADIEKTRADLGKTTQALTDKLDVKARATEAASESKHRVVEKANDAKGAVVEHTKNADGSVRSAVAVTAVTVAVLAVVLGVIVWRRRR
ncbi:MAG TPA: DUF3618 domain-containing protein [Mycobacterium sp.]|nr:DUF3618 domain-containing protein [Mycobacterium sp.]